MPLTTLLSWAWIAHTIEADNAFEATSADRVGRHFRISLPLWTNGLRWIGEDGTTVDALRFHARARCNLGGLERWGWISIGGPGGRARRPGYGSHRGVRGDTALYPTRAGVYARRLWPRVLGEVEGRWRARFGAEVVDVLRDALLAAAVPVPWSPPETHPSDGFYSHIVEGHDTVEAERPLVALLGQVLTACTLSQEREMEVSLPLGANFVRVLGRDARRLRDLPALTGISKEGTAMATGYLQRNGLAAIAPGRTVGLTARGADALSRYQQWSARERDTPLRTALELVVSQRSALSCGLVPPEGCWRGANPYLAQTKRLLADPTGALPWHPMVLHRGAWPDAS